jgi:hypothetical protein
MTGFLGVITVSRDHSSIRAAIARGQVNSHDSCHARYRVSIAQRANLVSFSSLDLGPRSIDLRICRSMDLSWNMYEPAMHRRGPQ